MPSQSSVVRPGWLAFALTALGAVALGGTGAFLLASYRSAALDAAASADAILVRSRAHVVGEELTSLVDEAARLSRLLVSRQRDNGSWTNPAVDVLFAYTGRYRDKDTGLQNNLHRWYDPKTGRWMTEDPIGFEAGDANVNRYCGNGPTMATDPSTMRNRAKTTTP